MVQHVQKVGGIGYSAFFLPEIFFGIRLQALFGMFLP
jgi:hypothetical protein